MSDSTLRRLIAKRTESPPSADGEEDMIDDCEAFGCLRGLRERATMLQLRLKDGNMVALGYAWLERADYDPSDGILLRFTGQQVRIVGRNLNAEIRPNMRLFDGLTRHRVAWIQEADEPTSHAASKQATVVEQVEWL